MMKRNVSRRMGVGSTRIQITSLICPPKVKDI
jgi:serine/threonine protein phosphatase PrpC